MCASMLNLALANSAAGAAEMTCKHLHGGDLASTWVAELAVHAERVVTLVKQSL